MKQVILDAADVRTLARMVEFERARRKIDGPEINQGEREHAAELESLKQLENRLHLALRAAGVR